MYGVYTYKNGEKKLITLDDYIPTVDGVTVFSHANGKELWVILLEKAWAKVHGSYERIIGGVSYQTMRDLTGAPGWSFKMDTPDLFRIVIDADKREFSITAGIDNADYQKTLRLKDLGLIAGHAYSLIAAAEVVDKKGKNVNLVQLRNPWG